MREIKFRMWNGERMFKEEELYSYPLSLLNSTTLYEKGYRFMQYTGLKDKNGKEIYEGDVVWCRAGKHSSGLWEYEKRFVAEYGWTQSMLEMSMCDEIEVIGNIYDNPELLEGQE